jgi:hypothetical protein
VVYEYNAYLLFSELENFTTVRDNFYKVLQAQHKLFISKVVKIATKMESEDMATTNEFVRDMWE